MNVFTPVYVFDLDGTLCLHQHRLPLLHAKQWEAFHEACINDSPCYSVLGVLQALHVSGAEIWFVSGRSNTVREHTVRWLAQYTPLPADEIEQRLFLRKEGDRRDDDFVKEVWLHSKGDSFRARIAAVFEDRDRVVKMWRRNGLTCLQVAEGNF